MRFMIGIAVSLLMTGSAWAQTHMFLVEYVSTSLLGTEVMAREDGTHWFSTSGHHRTDRVIQGERTTEIFIPDTATADAERIEINHTIGVARRGPLNLPPEQALELERTLTRRQAAPPGSLQYEAAMEAEQQGLGTVAETLGLEARGPLVLQHERFVFEEEPRTVHDSWYYRFPNSMRRIVLESLSRSTTPDGREAVSETRIVSAERIPFDAAIFQSAIPAGMPVQDIWERLLAAPTVGRQR